MKLSALCLFALPAVLSVACGSSSSTPPATGGSNSPTLNGTYVPATASDLAKAEFASITFQDATNYSYVRANCTSSSCMASGTYTFDGSSNLELKDAVTHESEHVDFQAVKVASGTSLAQSTHLLDSLVMGGGSGLIADGGMLLGGGGSMLLGDGGSLLQQILQALMNGIMMALQAAAGQDGGSSTGDDDDSGVYSVCADPNIVAACVSSGGQFTNNADGTCTCTPPDAGVDAADANVPDAGPDAAGDDSGI